MAKEREVVKYMVEDVANTFKQTTITLTSEGFDKSDLEKGVTLIKAYAMISHLDDAGAANDYVRTRVQITKTSQSANIYLNDVDLQYEKRLEGNAGAAAGCINYANAHEWPRGGVPTKPRRYKISASSPYIYVGIKSEGLAAVNNAYVVLTFLVED